MANEVEATRDPQERLTRLCNEGLQAIRAHPEFEEADKAIVFVDNGNEKRGGGGIAGYDDMEECFKRGLEQMEAIAELLGKRMVVMPLEDLTNNQN